MGTPSNPSDPSPSIGKDKILYSENFLEIGPVDGLIGYWPMNGNLLDYSLNNNDGTATDATVVGGFAPRDKYCYEFLTAGDKVDLNDTITLSAGEEWSLSFWGYKDSYGYFHGIGGNQTASQSGMIYFITNTSDIRILTTGTDATISVSSAFPTGAWFHFVLTHTTGNLITAYKNGSSVGSATPGGDILFNRIGDASDDSAVSSFIGHMFDFRIYNKVLSTEEINILSSMFDTTNGTEMKLGRSDWYTFGEFKEQL